MDAIPSSPYLLFGSVILLPLRCFPHPRSLFNACRWFNETVAPLPAGACQRVEQGVNTVANPHPPACCAGFFPCLRLFPVSSPPLRSWLSPVRWDTHTPPVFACCDFAVTRTFCDSCFAFRSRLPLLLFHSTPLPVLYFPALHTCPTFHRFRFTCHHRRSRFLSAFHSVSTCLPPAVLFVCLFTWDFLLPPYLPGLERFLLR